MKKFMVGILIITLLTPMMVMSAFAGVDSSIYTKNQIEEIVREKLKLDQKVKLKYSNLQTDDIKEKKFWNLEFDGENTSISVTVDAATGHIANFYKWQKDNNDTRVNILSQMARNKAINFIQDLEGNKFKETKEITSKAPSIIVYDLEREYQDFNNYNFTFVRKLQGEFFPNNYFKVQVSGSTGEITQYQMQWDEGIYDNRQVLISQENARNLFEQEDQLKLKYVALNTSNKDRTIPILTPVYVYTPKGSSMVSAIDGRFLEADEIYYQGHNYLRNRSTDSMGGTVSEDKDAGLEELIPEEGVLSKEKIEKIVINTFDKEIDLADFKVQDSSYFNNYLGREGKYWRVYWRDESRSKSLNATIDAKKGNIISLDFYKNTDEVQPIEDLPVTKENIDSILQKNENDDKDSNKDIKFALDEKNIQKEVLNKVQKIFPHIKNEEIKFELTKESTDKNKKPIINLNSSRYVNDIPYEENYLRLSYNYETGEILTLSYNWNTVEVQPTSKIIDKKTISKKFYDKVGFERYLIQIIDQKSKNDKGLYKPLKELLPIYTLKSFDFSYIDGISGKFLNYNGEEYVADTYLEIEFKDLRGYKYENEINLMNKMGILKEKDNYFHPNNSLLRKDAIKWIVEMGWRRGIYSINGYYEYYQRDDLSFKDVNKDDPYYPYIVAAVKAGIIDSDLEYFRPDEKIQKLEVTKWIINAMQKRELAEFVEIFQNPYLDKESTENKDIGYIALAKYYNIYKDIETNENFEGERILTRGEFIKGLYNLMKR